MSPAVVASRHLANHEVEYATILIVPQFHLCIEPRLHTEAFVPVHLWGEMGCVVVVTMATNQSTPLPWRRGVALATCPAGDLWSSVLVPSVQERRPSLLGGIGGVGYPYLSDWSDVYARNSQLSRHEYPVCVCVCVCECVCVRACVCACVRIGNGVYF